MDGDLLFDSDAVDGDAGAVDLQGHLAGAGRDLQAEGAGGAGGEGEPLDHLAGEGFEGAVRPLDRAGQGDSPGGLAEPAEAGLPGLGAVDAGVAAGAGPRG